MQLNTSTKQFKEADKKGESLWVRELTLLSQSLSKSKTNLSSAWKQERAVYVCTHRLRGAPESRQENEASDAAWNPEGPKRGKGGAWRKQLIELEGHQQLWWRALNELILKPTTYLKEGWDGSWRTGVEGFIKTLTKYSFLSLGFSINMTILRSKFQLRAVLEQFPDLITFRSKSCCFLALGSRVCCGSCKVCFSRCSKGLITGTQNRQTIHISESPIALYIQKYQEDFLQKYLTGFGSIPCTVWEINSVVWKYVSFLYCFGFCITCGCNRLGLISSFAFKIHS